MLRQCSSPPHQNLHACSTKMLHNTSCSKNTMNLVVETYKFSWCGSHTVRMMLLQGREGDSPAADQVPGRQAWAGGRIRGTVCQFIPFLEALLTIRVCYFFLLACVDDLVSMHLYFSPLFFFVGCFFFYVLFPSFFSFLSSSHFIVHASLLSQHRWWKELES